MAPQLIIVIVVIFVLAAFWKELLGLLLIGAPILFLLGVYRLMELIHP